VTRQSNLTPAVQAPAAGTYSRSNSLLLHAPRCIIIINRTLCYTGHRQPLSVDSGPAAAQAARDDLASFILEQVAGVPRAAIN